MSALHAWSGVAGGVTSRRPMLADEIRQLSRLPGFSIGAHTVNHLCLEDQPPDVWRREMVDSRAALEAITERFVRGFAYPYGALNRTIAATARPAFSWSVSCDALAVADSFDAARVPRLEAGRLDVGSLAGALAQLFEADDGGAARRLTCLPR